MPRRTNELGDWRKLPSRVEVEWVDSEGTSGWHSVEKERGSPPTMNVVTVGYLFERGRSHIKIVQSLSANNNVDHVVAIPRCAVRKITPLAPKEPG